MPVTSDMAWQLPLARLLEAKCPSTGFRTPLGILLPMASDRHKLRLSATSVDQLSRNNSETEEKLAFSYAFAQLKHNEVIERGTHAQVKEVRLGRPDICGVPLRLAWLCLASFTADKGSLHGVNVILDKSIGFAMTSKLTVSPACRATC